MTRPTLRRRTGARGSALVEFVWLGLLLLVPVVWIVLSVFEVQRGAFATTAAARAAARAYTTAPTEAVALDRARAAARQAFLDQGLGDVTPTVQVSCSLGPGRCLAGTSVVSVTVRSSVVLPLVPDALGGARPTVALDAVQRLPVGTYVEGAP